MKSGILIILLLSLSLRLQAVGYIVSAEVGDEIFDQIVLIYPDLKVSDPYKPEFDETYVWDAIAGNVMSSIGISSAVLFRSMIGLGGKYSYSPSRYISKVYVNGQQVAESVWKTEASLFAIVRPRISNRTRLRLSVAVGWIHIDVKGAFIFNGSMLPELGIIKDLSDDRRMYVASPGIDYRIWKGWFAGLVYEYSGFDNTSFYRHAYKFTIGREFNIYKDARRFNTGVRFIDDWL